MCGINGFNFRDEQLIQKMNELTRHRGPDRTGVFCDEHISIGNNLLAIMELSDEYRVPCISEDKRYILTYNGEVYNYKVLREELKASGYSFLTASDTEVILKGLIAYGPAFIDKLDGMFAFAFYDTQEKKLLLARDAAGMKPLYFYHSDGKLIFSSEIRAILASVDARLNHDATGVYFTLGYVPGRATLFRDIQKVLPGEYVLINLERDQIQHHRFPQKTYSDEMIECNPHGFREMMGRSVAQHTMGLRPFGLYLSGGLDSTIILHELSKHSKDLIKTYTTRFDINDPELNQDADMAKQLTHEYQIDHHELLVTEQDFINAFDATIQAVEEPRYHISMPAYWLLAQRASQDITVVLSGNGGDELFMGYDRYLESQKIANRYKKYGRVMASAWYTLNALRKGKLRLGHVLNLADTLTKWSFMNAIQSLASRPEFKNINCDVIDLTHYLASFDYLASTHLSRDQENAIAELDRLLWLADEEFLRADKIAMHFSMEGRFPFLAQEVIRYADRIPSDQKLKHGTTKALVREAYRGHLPDYIINKEKTGWYAPAVAWMKSDFGTKVRETLSPSYYPETAALFDLDFVRTQYVDTVSEFTRANMKKFMPIVAFQIWARTFNVKM